MTTGTLVTRILPPSMFAGRRAHRLLERNLMVYRRIWIVLFSGFFEPVFYLFGIGVGLGQFVGDIDGVSYAAFVAPGLLAASAMNGAVYESTFNIFFKLKWGKIYDAILATPMQPGDIALGEIAWSLIRGLLYATGFLVVMLAFGLMPSAWGLLALPAALLIGFAFAAVGMATTTFMKGWQDFDMVSMVTLPLFLFSTTFFPLERFPGWLQPLARLSPLYHGVELIRGFTLGEIDVSILGHIAFLVAMGLAGLAVASRRLSVLLLR
jgi:lipooligosaccharide transport system permease protein